MMEKEYAWRSSKRYSPPTMYIDYKQGLEVPTIGWKISDRDVQAYQWNMIKRQMAPPQRHGNTCTFRRFPSLISDEERDYLNLPTLVKALLGFEKYIISFYTQGCEIHNDAWVVNFKTCETQENVLMDALLKGLMEMKEQVEGKVRIGVDVSDELKDLLKVYTEAEEHLKTKEVNARDMLDGYMTRYLDAKKERREVTEKLHILKAKLTPPKCPGCDEEDDEEGDDE